MRFVTLRVDQPKTRCFCAVVSHPWEVSAGSFKGSAVTLLYALYSDTRQTQVDIKPGWRWSLMGVRWSWVAYTQEAGTLDQWEEKGALERYKGKEQWREGYTWRAWSSPQLWRKNRSLTYEHRWIDSHQHLCSRPVTLKYELPHKCHKHIAVHFIAMTGCDLILAAWLTYENKSEDLNKPKVSQISSLEKFLIRPSWHTHSLVCLSWIIRLLACLQCVSSSRCLPFPAPLGCQLKLTEHGATMNTDLLKGRGSRVTLWDGETR